MSMLKYVLKRIGLMIVTFSVIILICFVLIKLLPVNITGTINEDPEKIKNLIEARGFNKPIMYQLFIYIKRIFLDGYCGIGTEMYFNQSVSAVFVKLLPPTILINIYSSLIAIPIGLALGIYAALRKNKWQDHLISTSVMILISVPSFVYAFLILYLLCFKLGWFPQGIYSLTEAGGSYLTWKMLYSMVPPVFSMALGSIAGYTRYTRAELTEVLTSEYMLLARTKGLTKSQATVRHALRNAMVPIFPMIIGEFIGVLSGSLVIEKIFEIPGVGGLYLDAIQKKDYDFFMFLSGFYILVSLAAGLVIDLSYGFIDPRIRMGAK